MFELSRCQRYLIFYGKGGIGKTSVAINLAFCLNQLGEKVAVIGCSPKSSLWDTFCSGDKSTILDIERELGLTAENVTQAIWLIKEGLILVEAGGPEPGVGCGGRGLIFALESLKKYKEEVSGLEEVSYAIYDVIGDVVCGGFAMPMRGGGQRDVYIVTSGELMSLYAANNIGRSVAKLASSPSFDIRVGGYIANMRGVANEREILEKFSQMTNVPILAYLPRDVKTFGEAEKAGLPVVSALPDSEVAQIFRDLAKATRQGQARHVPTPIERYEDLFEMFMSYQQSAMSPLSAERPSFYQRGDTDRSQIGKRDVPKRVSIYGTGGIGKSTVASNVSAALVALGEKVYQVGCDPKRDSISSLCGELKPTVLDTLREQGSRRLTAEALKKLVFPARGYDGWLYGTECGGPAPGKGCAGHGVDIALDYLEKFHICKEYGFTFVLYDVLGDTVCGGFATPLKYARQTYVVTSGEIPSLVQAMKICQSVEVVRTRGLKVDSMAGVIAEVGQVDVGIAGIINNRRGLPHEEELVEEVFSQLGLPVVMHIVRSELVQEAENLRTTVVQAFPNSDLAQQFFDLARKIQAGEEVFPLKREILSRAEIVAIANKHK